MAIHIFISLSWNFIVSPSTSSALKCLSDFLDFANFILFTLMSNSELKMSDELYDLHLSYNANGPELKHD